MILYMTKVFASFLPQSFPAGNLPSTKHMKHYFCWGKWIKGIVKENFFCHVANGCLLLVALSSHNIFTVASLIIPNYFFHPLSLTLISIFLPFKTFCSKINLQFATVTSFSWPFKNTAYKLVFPQSSCTEVLFLGIKIPILWNQSANNQ